MQHLKFAPPESKLASSPLPDSLYSNQFTKPAMVANAQDSEARNAYKLRTQKHNFKLGEDSSVRIVRKTDFSSDRS